MTKLRTVLLKPIFVLSLAAAVVVPAMTIVAPPAAATAAVPELTDAGLEQMIFCESNVGGRYRAGGGRFRGAVQWVVSTWQHAAAGAGYPEWSNVAPQDVPPDIQDAVTKSWWAASTPAAQWPRCHREALAVMNGTRALERVCDPGNEWGTGPLSRIDGTCPGFAADVAVVVEPVNIKPIGHMDRAWLENGTLAVGGWAHDPDYGEPLALHVWTNEVFLGTMAASRPRIDLPFDGAFHGYFELPENVVYVCVAAIDGTDPDLNTWIGCVDVE